MNRFLLPLALLCLMLRLPTLAQSPLPAGYDPKAIAMLEQASATYKAFTSYSVAMTIRQEFTPHHGQTEVTYETATYAYSAGSEAWRVTTADGGFDRRTDGQRLYLMQGKYPAHFADVPAAKMFPFNLLATRGQEIERQAAYRGLFWLQTLLKGWMLLDYTRRSFYLPPRTVTLEAPLSPIGVDAQTVAARREAGYVCFTIGVYDHLLYRVQETWGDYDGGKGVTTTDYGAIQINPSLPDALFLPPTNIPQRPELTATKIDSAATVITWDKGRRDGLRVGDRIDVYAKNSYRVAEGQVSQVRADTCDMQITSVNGHAEIGNTGIVVLPAIPGKVKPVKRLRATQQDWELIEMAALRLLQDPKFRGVEDFAPNEAKRVPRSRLLVSPTMLTWGIAAHGASYAESHSPIAIPDDRVQANKKYKWAQHLWTEFGRRNAGSESAIVPSAFSHCQPRSSNISIQPSNRLLYSFDGLAIQFALESNYPDVKGTISPFLPAYSRDRKDALVYMFTGPGPLGEDVKCHFHRERTGWKLVNYHRGYRP